MKETSYPQTSRKIDKEKQQLVKYISTAGSPREEEEGGVCGGVGWRGGGPRLLADHRRHAAPVRTLPAARSPHF